MKNFVVIGVLVVIALLVGFGLTNAGILNFGGASGEQHRQYESFLQGLGGGSRDQFSVSNNGSVTLGTGNDTTCNLSQSTAGSHAATTSKEYFCAVTGVVAGDTVYVRLPAAAGAYSSGASSLYGGFVVGTAFATTSGRIGVLINNFTGAATTSAAQATTSAKVLFFH